MPDAPTRLDEAVKQIKLAGREIDDTDARDDLQLAIGHIEDVRTTIDATRDHYLARNIADSVESGTFDAGLFEDADREDIEAFLERADTGEFGPVDPGLEEAVRIARNLLETDTKRDTDARGDSPNE